MNVVAASINRARWSPRARGGRLLWDCVGCGVRDVQGRAAPVHGHSDTRVQPDALDGDAVPAEYFAARPTAVCDLCDLDTARSYPWTTRVLDIHHLLPLCSGMRVDNANTTFDDLVPICPTCHRAVHRFYDIFLRQQTRNDFTGVVEARATYDAVKQAYPGPQYAA